MFKIFPHNPATRNQWYYGNSICGNKSGKIKVGKKLNDTLQFLKLRSDEDKMLGANFLLSVGVGAWPFIRALCVFLQQTCCHFSCFENTRRLRFYRGFQQNRRVKVPD